MREAVLTMVEIRGDSEQKMLYILNHFKVVV